MNIRRHILGIVLLLEGGQWHMWMDGPLLLFDNMVIRVGWLQDQTLLNTE